MKTALRALIVLVCLAVPTIAFAQDRARPAPAREGRQIDGRTVYTWDTADAVVGTADNPWGEVVGRRGRMRRHTLVRIRQNFIPEALKSVENL